MKYMLLRKYFGLRRFKGFLILGMSREYYNIANIRKILYIKGESLKKVSQTIIFMKLNEM